MLIKINKKGQYLIQIKNEFEDKQQQIDYLSVISEGDWARGDEGGSTYL